MKRTKYIPAIVTLVGCLAASIIAIVNRYDALHSMIIILSVLVWILYRRSDYKNAGGKISDY